MSKYTVAHNNFEVKYGGIPGDLKRAEAFNLDENEEGTSNTCTTIIGESTFNGNGNGFLNGRALATRFDGEIMNYFIHLSNSGFIQDKLGRTGGVACNYDHSIGLSYPESELGGGLIALSDYNDSKRRINYILGGFGGSHAHSINNASEGNANNIAGNYFTPKLASQIEAKIEDTIDPLNGLARVVVSYQTIISPFYGLTVDSTDAATNCVYNSEYNISLEESACTIAIRMKATGY